jgi:hypothetical protein
MRAWPDYGARVAVTDVASVMRAWQDYGARVAVTDVASAASMNARSRPA